MFLISTTGFVTVDANGLSEWKIVPCLMQLFEYWSTIRFVVSCSIHPLVLRETLYHLVAAHCAGSGVQPRVADRHCSSCNLPRTINRKALSFSYEFCWTNMICFDRLPCILHEDFFSCLATSHDVMFSRCLCHMWSQSKHFLPSDEFSF